MRKHKLVIGVFLMTISMINPGCTHKKLEAKDFTGSKLTASYLLNKVRISIYNRTIIRAFVKVRHSF